jgi:hypothetical protein
MIRISLLDPNRTGKDATDLEIGLRRQVVEQDGTIEQITDSQIWLDGAAQTADRLRHPNMRGGHSVREQHRNSAGGNVPDERSAITVSRSMGK